MIEGRNTGVSTILRAMEANGSDIPQFETDEDRIYFTVTLPIHKSFLMPETAESVPQRQRRSSEELKPLVITALEEYGNLSTTELALKLGYVKATTALSKAIQELIKDRAVKYLKPEKKHSRNQKVCLIKN